MLAYYLKLAAASLKRHRALTLVMILALALGIGACMTTLTVYHVLSANPIPEHSARLFHPQIEPRPKPGKDGELLRQLTRLDAETLLREARARQQAVMSAGNLTLYPDNPGLRPMQVNVRYTSADFFPMFGLPLAAGKAWDKQEDDAHARVAVISSALNRKLFANGNAIGQRLQLGKHAFRIIGVLGEYSLRPRFYDMSGNRFGNAEEIFLPYSTSRELNLDSQGSLQCWAQPGGEQGPHGLNAPCAWLQYWVRLDSAAEAEAYRQYLVNYSEQQKSTGRFALPPNVRLHDVMQWLELHQVVPRDVRLQLWLALGFLLVCLINTMGLMLAKFLRRSSEYGVRRALGASRSDIFKQCLTEAGLIGLAGGALGLALAFAGLWLVRQQPETYAQMAQMDLPMLLVTFVLAVTVSLAAGLLPAWRACRVLPAIHLKA